MKKILYHLTENWIKHGYETIVVFVGIFGAFSLNNWNEQRMHKQEEIQNLNNIYNSFNENMQVESLSRLITYCVEGEELWLNYLKEKTPYHDSLLNYAYYIGASNIITPDYGLYESIKSKGMQSITSDELRNRLTMVYEQNLVEINHSVESFNQRFSAMRIELFQKYFELSIQENTRFGKNWGYFDYSGYKIKRFNNREEVKKDKDFLELVKVSYLFHLNLQIQLQGCSDNIGDIFDRIGAELRFLQYGDNKKDITFRLIGYTDVEEVALVGYFNSWRRRTGIMTKTSDGWEKTIELYTGDYEYKFIINRNKYIVDPANPDSIYRYSVDSYNSVIRVE